MTSTQMPAAVLSAPPLTETPPPAIANPTVFHRPILKRALLALLLAAVLIAAAIYGRHWWTAGRFIESTDDAYVGGNITAIATQASGYVAQVAVADNQVVHAGDLLVQLDDRDYRAALARAEAAVAMQQAVLPNLEATRQVQESVIAQAHAAIRSIAAEIKRTRDDADRAQKLLAASAVSEQVYQLADTDYVRAQADGEKARAALEVAERQLAVIATQKLQAEAALQQAIALRETARLNLGYTHLRAPVDGIVGNRNAQVGAYATAGAQLISLVPLHGLWIDANFKETQIAAMHPGSPAAVTIDSLPGRVFPGHVASIAPATGAKFSVLPPENATGNFTRIVQRLAVRIILDDEGAAALRPGLSVKAEVDTLSSPGAGS